MLHLKHLTDPITSLFLYLFQCPNTNLHFYENRERKEGKSKR
uniref:Uncharacterized protein n=1 Tax=Labrus bergylta TaxID=56723 RepID=A0A3Q3GG82_9LABR